MKNDVTLNPNNAGQKTRLYQYALLQKLGIPMSTVTISDSSSRSSRSIQEFWIDFLLEEEFNVSTAFCESFLTACDSALRLNSVISVAHSVVDKRGEADLIVCVQASSGNGAPECVALLIEDKITAGIQPRQAERYRLRGNDGLLDRKWDRYITVLVAPAAYLSSSLGFDVPISFEALKNWIAPDDQQRRDFKLRRLDEAITKKSNSGVQIVDRVMTAFRHAYYSYLNGFNAREGTDFRMRSPKDTYYGDTWFILNSGRLPKSSLIRHMALPGHIDLTFKDAPLQKASSLMDFLEQGMTLRTTGKYQQHVTIRIEVPKIDAFSDFDSHSGNVEIVLVAAKNLCNLYDHNQTAFDAILTAARRPQAASGAAASALVAKNA